LSKLAALVAIPLGLFALKRLQEKFPDDPTPKKIIPEGFTLGPAVNGDWTQFFPETLPSTIGAVVGPTTGIVATGPTVPLGRGQVWTPLFPDTAATAAEEFAAKKPFEFDFTGLRLQDIGEYKPFTLDDGMFDLSKAWSTNK